MTSNMDNAHISSKIDNWHDIDWKVVNREVTKLRYRIFTSCKNRKFKKVRSLQRLMLRSKSNLLLSIRRITSINAGKVTAGVDSMIVLEPKQKLDLFHIMAESKMDDWNPRPVRRIDIPKPDGRQRPIGIPTIRDRILQAMVKNALEPQWEFQFEDSSYGFRPARSVDDAMNRLYVSLSKQKRMWIVDADIKGCFDSISHDYLMEAVKFFPGKNIIGKWLKAGIMEEGVVIDSTGTPQGSIVSPLLCNIALHGLEKEIFVKRRTIEYVEGPRLLVRYADDFVVLWTDYSVAQDTLEDVQCASKKRVLKLAENKTRIVNLVDGFNFLGYTVQLQARDGVNPKDLFIPYMDGPIRDYQVVDGSKALLIIKPSKKSIDSLKSKIKEVFSDNKQTRVSNLIKTLNPILRGWALSKNCWHSNRTFHDIDNYIFDLC